MALIISVEDDHANPCAARRHLVKASGSIDHGDAVDLVGDRRLDQVVLLDRSWSAYWMSVHAKIFAASLAPWIGFQNGSPGACR